LKQLVGVFDGSSTMTMNLSRIAQVAIGFLSEAIADLIGVRRTGQRVLRGSSPSLVHEFAVGTVLVLVELLLSWVGVGR
jgi:hypothetical protein